MLETILSDTMHSDAQRTNIYGEFYWFDGTLTDPKLIWKGYTERAAFYIKFSTHFLMKLFEASSPILLNQIEVVQFCFMWDGNSGW